MMGPQCEEWKWPAGVGGVGYRCGLTVGHAGGCEFQDPDSMRARVAPGGDLEFVHAGGTVDVPPPPPAAFEARVRGLMYTACWYERPALLRAAQEGGHVLEAVLISRGRYEQLVAAERKAGLRVEVGDKP